MAILRSIERPADLKALTVAQLFALAQEIRQELLETIAQLGGHLASSLGAVELCLALHYVFDAPKDLLVWDMGYQAFAHKLITGRRDRFRSLKQLGGLSGFNNKEESGYDLFTTGHGGTVLSTALGLALARDQVEGSSDVVAIIGDASLGEGMALEALNHIGHLKPNLLVILNDNKMSIAKPIGGLSRYLNRLITNPAYNRLRCDIGQLVQRLPHGSKVIRLGRKVEESLKGLLVPGVVFEELGFRYVGPIDGHHLRELIMTLKNVKRLSGPILLHVSTVKGKCYRFAEQDPERFHKIEPFDLATGQLKAQGSRLPGPPGANAGAGKAQGKIKSAPSSQPPATFTEAFSDELIRLGEAHDRLVAITAAMPEGTGLHEFAKRFPDRFLDVGMAEQHALGVAAGLARGGARPIVAIYSTFLQRAFDQIMHELCLQRLPVVLAVDRAGLVGEDGPTHHGVFDLAYLRVLPHLAVLSPKDPPELRAMLQWALQQEGPVAIRYSRGGIVCGELLGRPAKLVTGKSETLRTGGDVALLALGSMVYPALNAAEALAREGIEATVINARFVRPLDEAVLKSVATQIGRLVTLEEAQLAGGFGSAVSEALGRLGSSEVPHLWIGLPDAFVEHGKRSELLTRCQLDPEQLAARIAAWHGRVTELRVTSSEFRVAPETRNPQPATKV
ncbi:MAG: 1-deoxy-D-xylulose-5-phosphate synthase [Candidatus Omnitrophota bacterium]|nr:1-deoxy-D-xylulose-5-phosphate synthase [Candidatus Omnitrophota bacterium]